ncbi:hypothetical protein [Candidatus Aalborgicola defluviihabitans]
MTPLRQRMLDAMTVRGLAERTRSATPMPSPEWHATTTAVPTC